MPRRCRWRLWQIVLVRSSLRPSFVPSVLSLLWQSMPLPDAQSLLHTARLAERNAVAVHSSLHYVLSTCRWFLVVCFCTRTAATFMASSFLIVADAVSYTGVLVGLAFLTAGVASFMCAAYIGMKASLCLSNARLRNVVLQAVK